MSVVYIIPCCLCPSPPKLKVEKVNLRCIKNFNKSLQFAQDTAICQFITANILRKVYTMVKYKFIILNEKNTSQQKINIISTVDGHCECI